nr:MAG TPA: hypothetical protein [Caudoviricetes sp.]
MSSANSQSLSIGSSSVNPTISLFFVILYIYRLLLNIKIIVHCRIISRSMPSI